MLEEFVGRVFVLTEIRLRFSCSIKFNLATLLLVHYYYKSLMDFGVCVCLRLQCRDKHTVNVMMIAAVICTTRLPNHTEPIMDGGSVKCSQ